jgi:hypothetical protein
MAGEEVDVKFSVIHTSRKSLCPKIDTCEYPTSIPPFPQNLRRSHHDLGVDRSQTYRCAASGHILTAGSTNRSPSMNRANRDGLEFDDLPDVTTTGLSALLRRDSALDAAIRDLISQLHDVSEVTFGWNNYSPSTRTASEDTNSTG